MKYRSLGNTALNVSVLGFGGSSLGSVFRPIDEELLAEVLRILRPVRNLTRPSGLPENWFAGTGLLPV